MFSLQSTANISCVGDETINKMSVLDSIEACEAVSGILLVVSNLYINFSNTK